MANITPTHAKLTSQGDQNVNMVTWALMTKTTDDVGLPFQNPGQNDRSVQVAGTFGAGGNLRILGSNDGTNYIVLTDPQGNALNFTAAGIETVMELTRYIKPLVTAGDVTTSLTVTLLARRGNL